MNRDDIIRMAREADRWGESGRLWHMAENTPETLERFAALVATAEREACAKVCEPQETHDDPLTAWKIAAAIRERGNK